MFQKFEVNIPLMTKQVSRYAKFLKELCTNKWKLKENEKEAMTKNVFAVLQKKIPPQCKKPSIFIILCTIGITRFERTMLSLRASINIMPYYIYASLNLGPLEETNVIIQLTNLF